MFRTQDAEQFRILYDKTRDISEGIKKNNATSGNCTDAQRKKLQKLTTETQTLVAENAELQKKITEADDKFDACSKETQKQLELINKIRNKASSIDSTLYGDKNKVPEIKVATKQSEFPTVQELEQVSETVKKMVESLKLLKTRFNEAKAKQTQSPKPETTITASFFSFLENISG